MRRTDTFALMLGCVIACGAPPAPQAHPTAAQLDRGATAPIPATVEVAPVATACEGSAVDLLAAIADPACRISEDEADRLRQVVEDPARTPLRVDATVAGDVLRQVIIVNTGAAPVTLPFLVHSHLDAFPARAGSLTLVPPAPAWPAGLTLDVGRTLAKVVLPPGGRAFARVQLDFTRLTTVHETTSHCPPNAKCAPQVQRRPLPAGAWMLRFRTPLYAVREDLEARVRWRTRPTCPGPAACPPGQQSVPGCYGGMAPRPEDCPPANRCVPANVPIPQCPALP